MEQPTANSTIVRLFYGLASAAIIIAGLSLGRSILIPLALATLLSFLLSPMVTWFRRWHVPRVAAVILVVALALVPIVGVGYVVGQQLVTLLEALPGYRNNILARVELVRGQSSSVWDRVGGLIEDIRATGQNDEDPGDDEPQAPPPPPSSGLIEQAPPRPDGTRDAAMVAGAPAAAGEAIGGSENDGRSENRPRDTEKPIPVEVRTDGDALARLSELGGMVLSPIGTAAVVVILVIFMLHQREDLHDRVIEIVGRSRVQLTKRALEDAGHRISRYLLMQAIINLTYGVPVGLALWLIGLPGAALWGLLATLLRFIPYLGPWMAASMPIVLSLAVFEGWTGPLMVVGVFVVLELFSNNVMEPWLYGTSAGMSQLAVILAMLFWGWMWGPIGILLAVPMTVCLVVAGKYIRPLEFFTILLGDRPTVATTGRFYRALIDDQREQSMAIAENYAQQRDRLEVYDGLLIPALRLVERERHAGAFDAMRQRQIRGQIHQIMDRVIERDEAREAEERRARDEALKVAELEGDTEAIEHLNEVQERPEAAEPAPRRPVVCVPAHDDADYLAAEMLADVLRQRGLEVRLAEVDQGSARPLPPLGEDENAIVCLSVLPNSNLTRSVAACSRLSQACRSEQIVVAAWGAYDRQARLRRRLRKAGATRVVLDLEQAAEAITEMAETD